jgi:N-dimethylarginine dimethylaminohydrolase
MTAVPDVVGVDTEWGLLKAVTTISPKFFMLTESINASPRRFYGTDDQPTAAALTEQHVGVVAALTAAGVRVVELEPTQGLPFQFNVRDAGVIIGSRLILGCMARAVWKAEPTALAVGLGMDDVCSLDRLDQGYLEGGDIAVTPNEIFVGLGERTDERGYTSLRRLMESTHRVTGIQLADGVLHIYERISMFANGDQRDHEGRRWGSLHDSSARTNV